MGTTGRLPEERGGFDEVGTYFPCLCEHPDRRKRPKHISSKSRWTIEVGVGKLASYRTDRDGGRSTTNLATSAVATAVRDGHEITRLRLLLESLLMSMSILDAAILRSTQLLTQSTTLLTNRYNAYITRDAIRNKGPTIQKSKFTRRAIEKIVAAPNAFKDCFLIIDILQNNVNTKFLIALHARSVQKLIE